MAKVKRALISVSDKTGIVDFVQGLANQGVEILSTGGTAKALRDGGIDVVDVSEYTESPEVMDGRVKTLHPRVHGGLLMRDLDQDKTDLNTLGGKPIDIVCVNLYPFEQTVEKGAAHDEVIENIDIGGPSMVRSAAKNHSRVAIVTDPNDYDVVFNEIKQDGEVSLDTRKRLAKKAFALTAAYDSAIASYFQTTYKGENLFPEKLTISLTKAYELRYGENPHQKGAFYIENDAPYGSVARAESLGAGGKELSFNNLVDVDATYETVLEFNEPAAVVVKHTNPCGVALGSSLEEAYRRAREADSVSAFGGIVALNQTVDEATAKAIAETFIECVIAPQFDDSALGILRQKKNLRILATGKRFSADYSMMQCKRIGGGFVFQERDRTASEETLKGKVVTKREPTEKELLDLDFAWKVCKHVKSNAIVFAKNRCTVGVGAGQMSRVISVQLAGEKAGELSHGSVMASDAFFPFADGIEAAQNAGITAIVQPGGSKRDEEVIQAANTADMAMVFTGFRHFWH